MKTNKDSFESCGLHKNWHRLLLFSSTSSPQFTRFPSLPILTLFITCPAESQLSNGLSSAKRTLVFCSAEIGRVPLLSPPFQHDRWPCDHPQLGPVESLPLPHMHESPHLGVISCSVHCHISKWFCKKLRSSMKPARNEKGVCCGTFPFTTCRSRLTTPAVSTNQNWKRICVCLCQKTVVESYDRSRSFYFLFFPSFNSMLSTEEFFVGLTSALLCHPVTRLLSIVHIDGLRSFHFSIQVEFEYVVVEIDRNEFILSVQFTIFSKMNSHSFTKFYCG